MRRLITYVNSLFLGMILGMIFVAIVHTCPTHRQEQNRAGGFGLSHLVHEIRAVQ
jgi:hypothetical protein